MDFNLYCRWGGLMTCALLFRFLAYPQYCLYHRCQADYVARLAQLSELKDQVSQRSTASPIHHHLLDVGRRHSMSLVFEPLGHFQFKSTFDIDQFSKVIPVILEYRTLPLSIEEIRWDRDLNTLSVQFYTQQEPRHAIPVSQ